MYDTYNNPTSDATRTTQPRRLEADSVRRQGMLCDNLQVLAHGTVLARPFLIHVNRMIGNWDR